MHPPTCMIVFRLLLSLVFSATLLWGQDTSVDPKATTAAQVTIEALESLTAPLRLAEHELEKLNEQLKKATTEEQKKDLSTQIDALRQKIKELNQNFQFIATGISDSSSTTLDEETITLQQELKDLFQPILRELRQITAQPRDIENLNRELATLRDRRSKADSAISRIDQLSKETKTPTTTSQLAAMRKQWEQQMGEITAQQHVLQLQLQQRKNNAPSLIALFTQMVSHFWRNRGLSLLLSLLGGVLCYTGIRRLYAKLLPYSPLHRHDKDSFASRLCDIGAGLLAILSSFFAAVMILYLRNDWLLLTAALILFFSFIWASRTTLPPYFEQIRLILNLGTVRIGERVMLHGVPWRIDSLHFFCQLSNPALHGASLRLSAKSLLMLNSRPAQAEEPWFPCNHLDWVLLDDGVCGQIKQQSPDLVVLELASGSRKSYATTTFLTKNPEVLSPQFSASTMFGLDPRHRELATTTIPLLIKENVINRLHAAFEQDNIVHVIVDFAMSSATSLDFFIAATVKAPLAPMRGAVVRQLQQAALDTANAQDWSLPCTAAGAPSSSPPIIPARS